MDTFSIHSDISTDYPTDDIVILISAEREEFIVSREISKMVDTIENESEILMPIRKEFLKKVIEYCEHFNFKAPPPLQKPLQFHDFAKCINDEWSYNFILQFDIRTCFDLANECDAIRCPSLFGLCCARLGHYFRTEPLNNLKKEFGLTQNKLTPEEKKEIIKSNNWLSQMLSV